MGQLLLLGRIAAPSSGPWVEAAFSLPSPSLYSQDGSESGFESVRTDPFRLPAVGRPGGFALVLGLLRWRRPEARLLVALSLVPQTLFIYDALPLFFIPRRASEAIALVVLSHFGFLMALNQPNVGSVDAQIMVVGNWVVWCLFLPALLMVLLRPNVAPAGATATS